MSLSRTRKEGEKMTRDEISAAQEAKRKYQREYMRRWRKKNRDKVREANLRYWLRKSSARQLKARRQKKGACWMDRYFASIDETARITGLSRYFIRSGVRAGENPLCPQRTEIFRSIARLLPLFGSRVAAGGRDGWKDEAGQEGGEQHGLRKVKTREGSGSINS